MALAPQATFRALDEVKLNGAVLAFALAVSVAPASSRAWCLRCRRAGPTSPRRSRRARRRHAGAARRASALVVAEVALALVLVVGAGLMIRTLRACSTCRSGWPTRLACWWPTSTCRSTKYAKDDQTSAFQTEVLRRVQALPGVSSAAFASNIPLDGRFFAILGFQISDQPRPPPGQGPDAETVWATPGYLKTLGIPLLSGRDLSRNRHRQIAARGAGQPGFRPQVFSRAATPSANASITSSARTRTRGNRRRHRRRAHQRARRGAGAADRPAQCAVRCDLHAHGGARPSGRPMDLRVPCAPRSAVDRDQPFAHPRTLEWVVEPVGGATALPDAPAHALRRGGGDAGRARHLRRDRLLGGAEGARVRHPHGAGRGRPPLSCGWWWAAGCAWR